MAVILDDVGKQDYAKASKAAGGPPKMGKQIAVDNLPSRMSRSNLMGPTDIIHRAQNNYSKAAPKPDGEGMAGLNIFTMGG